jgi:hypothetical protein
LLGRTYLLVLGMWYRLFKTYIFAVLSNLSISAARQRN